MTVPEDLLAILACPMCKTPVELLPDNSGLKCSTCKRIYPVRDGFPVMLLEEARLASE
jgi:LSD1 subclass zinc finger protein